MFMGGTSFNAWNQGGRRLKTYSFLLIGLCFLTSACKPDQTDPCSKPSTAGTPENAQIEVGADSTTCPEPTEPTEPTQPPVEDDGDNDSGTVELPTETQLFDAEVSFTNFSRDDEAKVLRAIELIKAVVRTQEFRNRVFNHTHNGRKTFVDNLGHSNERIYQIFLEGAEKLRPEKNSRMDLDLELYTNNSNNTVGYTYPSTLRIWMNTKYFNTYQPNQVARNLFHEWTHKLGFDHDRSATASRPYSVPYGVGKIIEQLASQVENEELALVTH